jgi:hypothetical protein
VRCLNFFCEVSAAALLTLGLAVHVSAQTNAPPEIPATDATNYLNQQVVVTDQVVQVALRPTVVLLNLNQRYPASPLTCVIRGADTNNFPEVESYLGKRVEITGRITDYQGRPEIVLTSTNQIKIITAAQISPKSAPPAVEPQTNAAALVQPTIITAPTVQPVAVSPPPVVPKTITAQAVATPSDSGGNRPSDATLWIIGALAIIIVLLGWLVFVLGRSAPGLSASMVAGISNVPVIAESSMSAEEWKQRALAAEAMAGKQGQLLREKIMPELTEFAKQSLVQGLYAQRGALIETQQRAQQALTQLESQLAALHLPLQERIRVYEKRIAELEKEVETQGEEMRELTRATLILVRKKLEDEKELGRMPDRFN